MRGTWAILKAAHGGRGVWLAILGISWFFSVGAVLLSEFAPLTSRTLGGGATVVTLFLLVFSVSIAVGSVIVNRLLAGAVSARYVPISALVLSAFLVDLWIAARTFTIVTPGADIAAFMATPGSWHILIALTGIAVSGGMFIVPLYAILQVHSAPREAGRRSSPPTTSSTPASPW